VEDLESEKSRLLDGAQIDTALLLAAQQGIQESLRQALSEAKGLSTPTRKSMNTSTQEGREVDGFADISIIHESTPSKLDLPATIEAHNHSLRNGLDCE
jgi:hypothetical protein